MNTVASVQPSHTNSQRITTAASGISDTTRAIAEIPDDQH
jgi:hypothetical protein